MEAFVRQLQSCRDSSLNHWPFPWWCHQLKGHETKTVINSLFPYYGQTQQRWISPTMGGHKCKHAPTSTDMQTTREYWIKWQCVSRYPGESYGTVSVYACVCVHVFKSRPTPYKENLYKWASWAHKSSCTINPNNPLRWEARKGGLGVLWHMRAHTHTNKKVHTVQLASPLCLCGRHSVAVPFS